MIQTKSIYRSLRFTMTVIALLLLILSNTSCEQMIPDQEEESRITLTKELVGHQYIYVNEENNMSTIYGGDTKLYYDSVRLTSKSEYIETSLDYYSTPRLLDLVPNTTYFLRAVYQDIESNILEIKTLPVDINCNNTVKYVMGDRSANQYGYYDLAMGQDRLSCVLMGDFKSCLIYLPQQWSAEIKEGIYTTVNDYEDYPYVLNTSNAQFSFKTFGDTIYYAKINQPLKMKYPPYSSSQLIVEFCDMVFVNSEGNEITLSGKLQ